jgi:hypothetical protein
MTRRLVAGLTAAVLLAAAPVGSWAQQQPRRQRPPEPPVVNLPVDPDETPPPAAEAPKRPAAAAPRAVACDGTFAKNSSHIKLATAYGPQNLDFTDVDGPDNSKLKASVLFPKDAKRRLEVWWSNEASRSDTSLIVINGQSTWTGPKGIKLGLALLALEKLNGKPFRIKGFSADGASVADWQDGAFDQLPGGCKLNVRLTADPKTPESALGEVSGDKVLMSSDNLVRAVKPKIVEILIGY